MAKVRTRINRVACVVAVVIVLTWTLVLWVQTPSLRAQNAAATAKPEEIKPKVTAASAVQAGKYLVLVGGCNDCHTAGYMQQGRAIPEDQWLTGMPVGFRGPWGTTYGSNLRTFVGMFTSPEMFILMTRARNGRAPMPWESLHAMSDDDLKAIYAYIKSLPVKGDPMPMFVGPGEEPKTPYFVFDPQPPKTAAK